VATVYKSISWIGRRDGLLVGDCRILIPGVTLCGAFLAVALPLGILLMEMGGQPGRWVYGGMPEERILEQMLYLLFYTDLCSGITEEMLF